MNNKVYAIEKTTAAAVLYEVTAYRHFKDAEARAQKIVDEYNDSKSESYASKFYQRVGEKEWNDMAGRSVIIREFVLQDYTDFPVRVEKKNWIQRILKL